MSDAPKTPDKSHHGRRWLRIDKWMTVEFSVLIQFAAVVFGRSLKLAPKPGLIPVTITNERLPHAVRRWHKKLSLN